MSKYVLNVNSFDYGSRIAVGIVLQVKDAPDYDASSMSWRTTFEELDPTLTAREWVRDVLLAAIECL